MTSQMKKIKTKSNINKVNIITVNYNSSDETIEMIKSLYKCDVDFKLIIVDNNSSYKEVDKILKYIENEKLTEINIIELSENIGYFPALNKGLDTISHDEKLLSYTIVCNNDLLFNQDFFYGLINSVYDSSVMSIAPSVKTINDIYQNPSMAYKPSIFKYMMYNLYYKNYFIGRNILKLWRLLGLGIDSNTKKDTIEKEIFIGIGAIYIILPSFFKINKNLNYPLFLYGEEAFFSQQLDASNGKLLYKPDIEVIHLESVSTNKIPSIDNYNLNKKAFLMYKDFYFNAIKSSK